MCSSSIKLLGTLTSPYVCMARVALNHKNLTYQFLEESLSSKSELLLKSNPIHKKVPVLIHNGKPISESLMIVQYIDDAWTSGPAMLPSDPFTRYEHRFWSDYVHKNIISHVRETVVANNLIEEKAAAERMCEALAPLEEAYRKMSGGERFFGGESIGYLDIALGSMLGWFKAISLMTGVEVFNNDNMPGLCKWAEAFCAHNAVNSVIPQTEKLVQLAKMIKERATSG